MSREKELIKNTFIISLGTFLPKFTNLITLPILTAYLTKTEYGTYDLIATLVSLVLPVATLKIESAAFRFLIDCRENRNDAKNVISTIYAFLLPVSLLVVFVIFLAIGSVNLYTRILICLYFLLDIVFSATQQIVRGLARNLIYSVSAITYSVINMLLIVLTVAKLSQGLNGVLVSMSVALAAGIIILFISTGIFKLLSFSSISRKCLKEMISYSWPMVPNSLSSWVIHLSDRLVVTAVLGIEVNAVYAIANKIPNLFAILQGTFTFAWQENASISVEDDDVAAYYSNMFDSIYTLLSGGMAALIGITPVLFKILINQQYADAYYQMPLLFGGMLFSAMASFLGGIYVAHKKTKSVGVTTAAAAAVNLIVNILLINFIGLYAASLSTLVSYLALTVFRMKNVQKFQPMRYNYIKIIIYFAALIVFGILCYINNYYLNILNFFLCFTFSIIVCRRMIVVVWKSIIVKIKK